MALVLTKEKIIQMLKNRGIFINENDIAEITITSTSICVKQNDKMHSVCLEIK